MNMQFNIKTTCEYKVLKYLSFLKYAKDSNTLVTYKTFIIY